MNLRRLLPPLIAILPLASATAQPAQLRYVIDDSHSEVEARVAFVGVSEKIAHFPDMSGSLALSTTDFATVEMIVNVDARTLTTGDSQTRRLRGPQFFDVVNHPQVRFAGRRIRFTGERTAEVSGEITARGVIRPASIAITFSRPLQESAADRPVSVVGTTTIDRRQFGMTAFPLIIGNHVRVTIRARMVPE